MGPELEAETTRRFQIELSRVGLFLPDDLDAKYVFWTAVCDLEAARIFATDPRSRRNDLSSYSGWLSFHVYFCAMRWLFCVPAMQEDFRYEIKKRLRQRVQCVVLVSHARARSRSVGRAPQ